MLWSTSFCRRFAAACLLAVGFTLGVSEAVYAAGCAPSAPVHVVLMDDFPVVSRTQSAEAIAEVKDAARQTALPGTRTILARSNRTTASLDILVNACLPVARKETGLLAWFSNPTANRQEKDRAQLLDTLAGRVETLAVEIGDSTVVKPFSDRAGKPLRRLEREIGAPEKITLVMSAGPAGAGGSPWRAASELAPIILASRHDDSTALA